MPRIIPTCIALLALAAPAAADPACIVLPAWREVATGVYVERPVLRCAEARPMAVERPCRGGAPAAVRAAAPPPIPSPFAAPPPPAPLRWETPRLLTNR